MLPLDSYCSKVNLQSLFLIYLSLSIAWDLSLEVFGIVWLDSLLFLAVPAILRSRMIFIYEQDP